MKKVIHCAAIAAALFVAAGAAQAAPFTGVYTTGGATTGSGPWTLTSTNSTFSLLTFVTNEHPDFDQLTSLRANFTVPVLNPNSSPNAGGGGGAPRLLIRLDTDNNGTSNGSIQVHLGTSPGYVDTPATLAAKSGLELIGNNDAGRYDLSQFGGSNFTDYAAALSLLGDADILGFRIIEDSFGDADKTLVVSSINASFQATAVPEPGSLALLSAALAVFGFVRRRKQA